AKKPYASRPLGVMTDQAIKRVPGGFAGAEAQADVYGVTEHEDFVVWLISETLAGETASAFVQALIDYGVGDPAEIGAGDYRKALENLQPEKHRYEQVKAALVHLEVLHDALIRQGPLDPQTAAAVRREVDRIAGVLGNLLPHLAVQKDNVIADLRWRR